MFLKIFQSIMTKEESFQQKFIEQSHNIVNASKSLKNFIIGSSPKIESINVIRIEEDADVITRNILQSLHRSFITPFDRNDIYSLATQMDSTIDYMEDIVQRAKIYKINKFTNKIIAQSEILVDCSTLVFRAIQLLPNISKNLHELTKIGIAISEKKEKQILFCAKGWQIYLKIH